jgi:hypothetical protein
LSHRSLKKGGDLMKNLVLGLIYSFYGTFTRLTYGIKKIECSEVMIMDGQIESAIFNPSHFEIQSISPSSCPGYNTFYNGDHYLYFYAEIPDQYETVFTSERGTITLLAKDAFDRFKGHKGGSVIITYYEIYQSIYNVKTNELIKRLEPEYVILGVNLK